MGNSSKNSSSKNKILYAVIAIVAVIAIYFIASRFFGGAGGLSGLFNWGTETQSTDGPLVVIDTTPDKTSAQSANATDAPVKTDAPQATADKLDENGAYYSKDDVVQYIKTYGKLPSNFITKDEAKALGWSGNGNDPVDKYAPGKVIGGDRFGNYEGLLAKKSGRTYTECDIDTKGTVRGVKRIVFSNDGLIYYTEDHYEHFQLIYGTP